MRHSSRVTCFLAVACAVLFATCYGQYTYESFSELVAGLTSGHVVTVNMDVSKCMNNFPPGASDTNINVALRHWWLENTVSSTDTTNTVLRVNDHFKGAETDLWVVREIYGLAQGRVDGQATWYYETRPTQTQTYLETCTFGEGAVFHKMTGELDETILVTSYEMLKSELLFGRHLVGVVDLHKCEGTMPSRLKQYTFGVNVWSFLIVEEGDLEAESIRIYSNFVADNPDQTGYPYVMSSFGLTVNRNDPTYTIITHGEYDLGDGSNESPFPSSSYKCPQSAARFYTRRYERDGTYNSYSELKTALNEGHQVEVVNFAKYCMGVSDPPEPVTNNIRGQMFDAWRWHPEGSERHGPGEGISFFNDIMSPSGYYNIEDATVFPDDSLHFNSLSYLLSDPGAPVFQGSEHCYLGGSTVFHANLADKSAVTTYDQVRSRFTSLGAIFEAEINMTQCETPDASYQDLLTFIMWESFLIPSGDQPGFEGVSFNLADNWSTPDVIDDLAWEVRFLMVEPSNIGTLLLKRYDAENYSEVESAEISCVLGEGLKMYQYYF